MDFFISIHNEEYEKSIWCQQELGFAIARKVDIFPIATTKSNKLFLPQGFAQTIQATKAIKAEDMARQIAATVRNSKKIGELYNQINPILAENIDDDIPF